MGGRGLNEWKGVRGREGGRGWNGRDGMDWEKGNGME